MQQERDMEYINQYLAGELGGKDLHIFQKRVDEDAAFAQELALQKKLREAITSHDTQRLDQVLREIGQDWDKRHSSHIQRLHWFRTPYKIAAIITLLIAVGALVYITKYLSPPSSQELFHTYYKPPVPSRSRGQGNMNDLALSNRAFDHYENGEYTQALGYFKDPAVLAMGSVKMTFYTAHSYLNVQEAEKAIQHFKEVIEHGDNVYIVESKWYLSLSYLKQGDLTNAKEQLRQIRSSKYKTETEELLKEINRIRPM